MCDLNEVEDECHVIVRCPLYQDHREELFRCAGDVNLHFNELSDVDKTSLILSDCNLVKNVARSLNHMLTRRKLHTAM